MGSIQVFTNFYGGHLIGLSNSLPLPLQQEEISDSSVIAHIILFGNPKPARLKKNKYGNIYNPRFAYMFACRWKIRIQYRKPAFEGPVVVNYYFAFQIPPSWPRSKKEQALRGEIPHTSTPDIDNLQKLYNDCIKKIVITDDKNIRECRGIKSYDVNPRTEIVISSA